MEKMGRNITKEKAKTDTEKDANFMKKKAKQLKYFL